ncbi:mitochondrial deoxynucleotide carrier [Lichtheimia corymbifera JMRC:FSU:9682]|uniref:Mitochondrial deoxynucleotide carrier n=1 Tax=Lichtheimia corymbifera JMRC:FSU:9682 TaxID=1263082 RepID=A0A068RXY1_9FUNG|nr:mitochondrial deoxynucleotide carrier [Lichtheimia corymbifera JMRC:FSU:9682]
MSSHITNSDLSPVETALCGGLAGMIARFVISPLDVVKIRLQVESVPRSGVSQAATAKDAKYRGVIQSFRLIAAEEGVKGFFKGNMSAVYLYMTYGVSQLFTYHHLDNLMSHTPLSSSPRAFVCGMLAGSFATTATYPFDLLRTRFAIQGDTKIYTSVGYAIGDIYKNEGVRGFYRGLWPSLTQIMPYMGLMFLSYDLLCTSFQWLRDEGYVSSNNKLSHTALAGSVAGALSKTGVYPLDVIRKRLQVQGPHRNGYIISSIPQYARTSIFSCMTTVVKTEGVGALYKGLIPGLLKAAPASAAYFLVFEFSKGVLIKLKASHVTDITSSSNNQQIIA